MHCVKVLCFAGVILSLSFNVHAVDSEIQGADDEIFVFLISGMQANLEKARSGKGILTCESEGEYFAPGSEEPRWCTAKFCFDGTKIRYDREFNYERNPTKDAKDDRYHFEYLAHPWDDIPHKITNAYVRTLDHRHGGEFFGEIVDLKRIMQPQVNTVDELLLSAEDHRVTKLVEEQSDGTFLIRIPRPDETGIELQLRFDPDKGFNIVRERMMIKGVLLDDIERTFREIDGVWMLESLTYARYNHEQTADGDHPIIGRQRFEVTELSLNEEVPRAAFDFRGFNLKPNTKVWDMVRGVNYTLDPVVAVEEQVRKILESFTGTVLESAPQNAVGGVQQAPKANDVPSEKNTGDLPTAEPDIPNLVGAQASDKPLGSGGIGSWAYVVVAGGAILMVVMLWRLKRRISHGR